VLKRWLKTLASSISRGAIANCLHCDFVIKEIGHGFGLFQVFQKHVSTQNTGKLVDERALAALQSCCDRSRVILV